MRILTLLLSLLSLPALGQTLGQTAAFRGASVSAAITSPAWIDTYYPTNIVGYPANAYWVADNSRCSTCTNANGLVTNWLDFSGNSFNLTNVVANSEPTISNNWINGHSVLSFDGSNDWLKNASYANAMTAHGIEYVLVCSFQWSDANIHYIARDSVAYDLQRKSNEHFAFVGAQVDALALTNKWCVIDVWADASGNVSILTNNVSGGSGPGVSTDIAGMSVGGRYSDGNNATPMLLAEFVTYPTNLTATIRSNLFDYFTNKYRFYP